MNIFFFLFFCLFFNFVSWTFSRLCECISNFFALKSIEELGATVKERGPIRIVTFTGQRREEDTVAERLPLCGKDTQDRSVGSARGTTTAKLPIQSDQIHSGLPFNHEAGIKVQELMSGLPKQSRIQRADIPAKQCPHGIRTQTSQAWRSRRALDGI